jgi:RNA polymerase sigma-70 factor (ECF subfamily)
MEEKDAISRIKQGDLNGLEELVNRYQVKAIYSAYLILQDRSLAEEVVQNAFLKATEKIHYFDESRTFSPWFLRIVVNDSIQLIRERKRFEPICEEPDEESKKLARWLIDSQPSPEQEIEVKQIGESLKKALKILTPEQRKAVVLRYYLQMSEQEVSDRLAKPLTTVKWWLRSARKRLKSLLSVDGDLPDHH